MFRQILGRSALAAGLVVPVSLGLVLAGAPAQANTKQATVSVLHAIPAGLGADVVDIYAGDALLIDDFTPGSLQTVRVPAGTYDLGVYADGQGPGNGTAVLSADGVRVTAGMNATVTANLNRAGAPALNVFVNDTKKLSKGQGRLTVRHIAAAPAVDIRANGNVLFKNLRNPNQKMADVPRGTYKADVVLKGTKRVVLGPADVRVRANNNTIVYAWGSAADGTLQLAVQNVPTRK